MGINPIEILAQQANLSKEELEDMSNQFEEFFNDMTNDIANDNNSIEMPDNEKFSIKNMLNSIFNKKEVS